MRIDLFTAFAISNLILAGVAQQDDPGSHSLGIYPRAKPFNAGNTTTNAPGTGIVPTILPPVTATTKGEAPGETSVSEARPTTTTDPGPLPPVVGDGGEATIEGILTITSGDTEVLPAAIATQTEGSTAVVAGLPLVTSASSLFAEAAAAAAALAANPAPVAQEVTALQNIELKFFKIIVGLTSHLNDIKLSTLSAASAATIKTLFPEINSVLSMFQVQIISLATIVSDPTAHLPALKQLAAELAASSAAAKALSKVREELEKLNGDGPDEPQGPSTIEGTITEGPSTFATSTSSATSSSSSSPAPDTCYVFTAHPPEDPDDEEGGEDAIERRSLSLHGRRSNSERVLKRATGGKVAGLPCQDTRTKPSYASYPKIEPIYEELKKKNPQTPDMVQDITWWNYDSSDCSKLTLAEMDGQAVKTMFPNKQDLPGVNPMLNVDHIWEKKLMQYFLQDMFMDNSKEKLQCADWDYLFYDNQATLKQSTLLQNLFDLGPATKPTCGSSQYEFAVMPMDVNGLKGRILNRPAKTIEEDYTAEGLLDTLEKRLDMVKYAGMAMTYSNSPKVKALFERANKRVYREGILKLDQRVKGEGQFSSQGPITLSDPGFSFADKYTLWMSDFVKQSGGRGWEFVKGQVEAMRTEIDLMPADDADKEIHAANLKKFEDSPLNKQEHYSFDWDTSAAAVSRRSLYGRQQDSCPLPPGPDTTNPISATASASTSASEPGSTASVTSSGTSAPAEPTSISPIDNPPCRAPNYPGALAQNYVLPASSSSSNINTLLYSLRDHLCNNLCDNSGDALSDLGNALTITPSSDNQGCELTIGLEGGAELWMYRSTPANGAQQQQCWDATQAFLEKCVKNGPNTAWWSGPSPGQFYQGGVREINAPDSLHVNAGKKYEGKTDVLLQPPILSPNPVPDPGKGTHVDCEYGPNSLGDIEFHIFTSNFADTTSQLFHDAIKDCFITQFKSEESNAVAHDPSAGVNFTADHVISFGAQRRVFEHLEIEGIDMGVRPTCIQDGMAKAGMQSPKCNGELPDVETHPNGPNDGPGCITC